MFVGVMAFFARISDSSVGGTYMTLLNTFTNLGGNWPSWVALRFVSELTWTSCLGASQPDAVPSCASDHEKQVGLVQYELPHECTKICHQQMNITSVISGRMYGILDLSQKYL